MPYPVGDPGFLTGVARLGRRVAARVAPHIPYVGPIVSAIGGAIRRHPTISAAGTAAAGGIAAGVGGSVAEHMMRGPVMPGGAALMHPGVAMAPGGGILKGYHMSKPYKCHGTIIPSHLVRNRHMRSTNPKALRRAIRRARGFERLARKVMHFVSPRAHKGRAVFRTRRRAK